MEGRSVLIADSSEDFCRELYNILHWDCQVRVCSRGRKALQMIRQYRPQVLVLDLMLPELDGISLLRAVSVSDCRPAILATTNLISSYILSAAQELQVDYLLVKPCDLHATAARIQEQLNRLEQPTEAPEDLRCRVSELLLLLGFSAKLRGFRYLREAVCLILQKPDQSITKELYPEVARICNSVPSHVERSVRGAIEDAWTHRDPRVWLLYFQPDGQGRETRPTNAAFISRLADGLHTAQAGSLSRPPAVIRKPEEDQPDQPLLQSL